MTATLAWIPWLIAMLVLSLSIRNPIYLALLLFGQLWLGAFVAGKGSDKAAKKTASQLWLRQNARLLLTFLTLSSLINMLFTHTGSTILFKLPTTWPIIGGKITLESVLFGLINGLIIGNLFILFNILNQALSIKQMTRLIPRAFYPLTMMITVGLTFFPSMQDRIREIKEAQMIRGNPMKKLGDWLPIFLPLLVSSLESAMGLSESMTARGFHIRQEEQFTRLGVISLMVGTFLVFSGWILSLYDYPQLFTLSLSGFGIALIVGVLVLLSQQMRISRYQKETPGRKDWILAGISTFTLIIFLVLDFHSLLYTIPYSPYPTLTLPGIGWAALFTYLPLLTLVLYLI